MKGVQNLKSFWRSSQNYFVFILARVETIIYETRVLAAIAIFLQFFFRSQPALNFTNS
jgi:hypothetical protein